MYAKKKNTDNPTMTTDTADEDLIRATSVGVSVSVDPLLNMFYPGIALQGRYSAYHTMRIQLKGKTRYHLIPIYYGATDDDHLNNDMIALFPSIHICAYQSQVVVSL